MAMPGTWAWPGGWALPSAVATALLIWFNLEVWRRRRPAPLWPALAYAMAGSLLFAVGNLASFAAVEPATYWTTLLVVYGGLFMAVSSYLVLALRFAEAHGASLPSGRTCFARATAVWAAAFWLLLLTNPWHGQFLTPRAQGPSDYHILWYVYAVAGYLSISATCGIYAWLAWRGERLETRRAARTMAAAVACMVLGNVIYIASPTPLPVDTTTVGLCVSCALLLVGAYRRHLVLDALTPTELVRQQSDGVLLIDAEGRLLHRNPAAASWFGEAPSAGDRVFPALVQAFVQQERDERPLAAAVLERNLMAEAQPPTGHLFRLRNRNRWGRVESTPLRDESGALVGRALRVRDETALQRLMDATAEQSCILEAVVAAADEGVLAYVGDEIRFVNRQFHELWRTPEHERDVGVVEELIDGCLARVSDPDGFRARIEEVARDPLAAARGEFALLDGHILEHTSLPLMREDCYLGRVWRVRDVTEQRRSEEALRLAQKLESLGVMAGGIAHDFNNLLVSVLGNAGLARMELPDSSGVRKYLADIERAAERASELTRQLLAYAGRAQIEKLPLDLSELVGEVGELARASVSRGVAIRCDLVEDLPAVRGDRSQLQQVVMNLVLNAADAIDHEQGLVTVSTRVEELGDHDGEGLAGSNAWRPGRYVALRVTDTGCGMEEALQQRVFDPFFTTKFTGRGLGLAATLGIVRSHDGFVRVESEPGLGSTFTVLLPAGPERAPRRAVGDAEPPPSEFEATALVVDDDPAVMRVAVRILEAAGLRTLTAEAGERAVEVYREHGGEIDLVLLDFTMPGMSGPATARALSELDPDVRILLSSGYPKEELADRLRGAGRALFIQKPYRREALIEKVHEALQSEARSES